MKRWILFFLAFALLIAGSFFGYMYVYRAEFLSSALSKALDTPVYVKKIEFSKNGLTIEGLQIENPAGKPMQNTFSVSKIKVKMDWSELLKDVSGIGSDRIVIDEIRIDKPKMVLELYSFGLQDNNWKKLIQKSKKSEEEKQAKGSAKPSRRFFIKKLLITSIQLEISYANLPLGNLTPPPIEKIELKNLGKDEPLSTQEVMRAVLEELLQQVMEQINLKDLIKP